MVKVPPYFPKRDTFDSDFSFVGRDYEIYKELGMNGVRLGAMYVLNDSGGLECNRRRIGTIRPILRRWLDL